ncbi:hypothetical protein AKJ16_DCAP17854 [Drosera capensis]
MGKFVERAFKQRYQVLCSADTATLTQLLCGISYPAPNFQMNIEGTWQKTAIERAAWNSSPVVKSITWHFRKIGGSISLLKTSDDRMYTGGRTLSIVDRQDMR